MSATGKSGKWKSLSKGALERWPIFTHLLGRFTSADYAGHGLVPMKTAFPVTLRLLMSIQQELYMHRELVRCLGSLPTSLCSTHTSVWCKVLSSSHNHPPATNTHLSGAPAGDSSRVVSCVRTRHRKGKTSDAWLSPTLVWFYLHLLKPGGVNLFHQDLFWSTKRGLETMKLCYPLS